MENMLKNRSGTVLVVVIMLTMMLSIIIIGILSLNVSQVRSSQSVIDELKAEYLAKGFFYQFHQQRAETGAAPLPGASVDLDGKTFLIGSAQNPGAGINNTDQIDLNINF